MGVIQSMAGLIRMEGQSHSLRSEGVHLPLPLDTRTAGSQVFISHLQGLKPLALLLLRPSDWDWNYPTGFPGLQLAVGGSWDGSASITR